LILGFGGHSKVIIDIAEKLGVNISGLYEDNTNSFNKAYNGIKVLGAINSVVSCRAIFV
jgi:hypothetical protein